MGWMLALHLMHYQRQAALICSLALVVSQEASVLFSTIEDFMWFKVALVRPPRPDAGPGSSHGMSMLAQGKKGKTPVPNLHAASAWSVGGASAISCSGCAAGGCSSTLSQ